VKLTLGEFYKTVEFIIFFKFLLAIAGTLVGMHGTPRFQLNPSWKTTDWRALKSTSPSDERVTWFARLDSPRLCAAQTPPE